MDKPTWLESSTQEKAEYMKKLLQQIIAIDHTEVEQCKTAPAISKNSKYKLEQRVLELMRWEKEDNGD